jgi:hypothetical protein
MLRLGLAVSALLFGACSTHDHVTDASELVDSWTHTSDESLAAMHVHFGSTGTFSMVLSDGSPSNGTYLVQDPLVLLSPANPAGTVWCSPKAVFSDSDNTMTFSDYDPAADKCGKASGSSPSPLLGVYTHD